MTLEEIIRERARKGEMNYLSLAFTERGWEVAYRGVSRDGALSNHGDPVCALLKALTGKPGVEPVDNSMKMVKRRRRAEKPADEFDDILG